MKHRNREGYRTINAVVPQSVYWLVRSCATESRLSMKDYMARFCLEAHPFEPLDDGAENSSTDSKEQVGRSAA